MNANWLTPPPHQRNDCHTISCGGAKRHDLQTAARSGRQTPHPWRRTPKLFGRHTPLSASGRTDTRSTVVAPLLVMTHTAKQPRRSAISQCHHAAGELWLPPVAAMNAASCQHTSGKGNGSPDDLTLLLISIVGFAQELSHSRTHDAGEGDEERKNLW